MLPFSIAIQNYPRSGIRVMSNMVSQYPDAINLTLGQPNFDTPEFIKTAACQSLKDGLTGYTHNAGIMELREAIARSYTGQYGLSCTPDNVAMCIGGMEALFASLAAFVNPGDEVIVSDPCYPNYLGQICMLNAKAVTVPVFEETGFIMQPEDLEKAVTDKTKIVCLNYPANPTGALATKEDIQALAEVVKKHDLIVISDEVYDRIVYDNIQYFSMSEIPEIRDNVIVVNSFSKTYAMTGWRMGYAIANADIISKLPQIHEAIISCVPGFLQMAAVEALESDQSTVKDMLSHYARRRDLFVDGLNSIPGFSCLKGQGAFYAFANIKSFGISSLELAKELLGEAGVACVHGSAFGDNGEGYLRFSYSNSDENLEKALSRIAAYVKKKY